MSAAHPDRNRNSPAEGSTRGGEMSYDIQPGRGKVLKRQEQRVRVHSQRLAGSVSVQNLKRQSFFYSLSYQHV